MPLEIREVVIKAQLERKGSKTDRPLTEQVKKQDLKALKEEILAYCLEKIDEQREKRQQSDRLWL